MFNKLLIYTISFLSLNAGLHGQEISSLVYRGHVVIPYDYKFNGRTVGGLSGIAYNSNDSSYYLVADKPPSRIFKAVISNDTNPEIRFDETLLLRPTLLSKSELEGIAYNYKTKIFYVSDEQKKGTRILEIDNKANFERIVEPINESFLPLSGHNSGIEGLTISNDLQYLLYSFERPEDDCLDQALVRVTKMGAVASRNKQTFFYKLHHVESDVLNTNGISEILFISENKILVMERAYIPGEGNVVRLYQALLAGPIEAGESVNCLDDSIRPLPSELLFDFANVNGFELDNAEGMTFNGDRSILYIVTDDNFSKKQQTQVIALDITWK